MRKNLIIRLLSLIKGFRKIVILAVINGIVGNLLAMSVAIFASLALAKALGLAINLSYPLLLSLMVLFGILRGVLRYFEQYSNHYIAFKILASIRHIIFEKVRSLSPSKVDNDSKGDLVSQITSDVETLEVFYAHTISPILIALIANGVIVIFLSLFVHYLTGLLALAFYLLIGVAIPLIFYQINKRNGKIYRSELASYQSFYLDILKGKNDIIFSQKEEEIKKENLAKTLSLQKQSEKSLYNSKTVRIVVDSLIILSALAMLFLNFYLFNKRLITFPLIIVSLVTLLTSFGPVVSLASLPGNLNQTFASARRLFALLDEKAKVKEVHNDKTFDFAFLDIKNLSFGYDEKTILNKVNFHINKGEIVLLKGQSGEGKSTLLKLLMRYYSYRGEIYYNDQELLSIDDASLKDNVSMFSQQTYLFNETIRDNLKIAKADASDEEIMSALEKASLGEFINNLPNKLDTVINESALNISLGEKQRIGLARVFLRKPKLLLLDEPTSNIDSLNASLIYKALLKEKGDMSVIIVSHQENISQYCDKVYLLKEGVIYE